jgi:hypothetical protein
MSTQNEEKMMEEFLSWWNDDSGVLLNNPFSGGGLAKTHAYAAWRSAIAKGKQERKQLESQLIASDAALKESRANDMESMRQLSESQKREAELRAFIKDLRVKYELIDELDAHLDKLMEENK